VLTLCLHMHQPDYRHPRSGQPIMPWVRLHATRGYRDVPRILLESGAQVTVNLVATLTEQIDRYVAGGTDLHLELCTKSADTLDTGEAWWLVEHALHGSRRAFGWFAGWGALLARRDRGDSFSTGQLRDLQVWSNLCWFGATALEDWPRLAELRRQGADFSEGDKTFVLDCQRRCLAELRSLYGRLPDIAASPWAHPILPLLVDTYHASRCMDLPSNPGFSRPVDALDQLAAGRAAIGAWTGREVRGLWPSEGSVSPEVVDLAAAAGFRWFLTDEGIRDRSERQGQGPTWQVGPLRALFRDRDLSDQIGFQYADRPAEDAAADLAAACTDELRCPGGAVLVLDGENPWESYADAGASFLRSLFGRVRTRTCSDLAEATPTGTISRIHTGSWIGADFRIWIGHEEDREAWRLLAEVRARVDHRMADEAVRQSIWRAEASDWCWWYGDEFDTPFAGEFDTCFRAHLAAACDAAGVARPEALAVPIRRARAHARPPSGEVDPSAGWLGWAAAGRIDVSAGSMAPSPGTPSQIRWGWQGDTLHLACDAGPGWRFELDGSTLRPPSDLPPHAALIHPRRRALLRLIAPDGHALPDGQPWVIAPPIPRPER
jgi:alpha-amylase/alpha-mannosidase (GH57 family)